MYPLWTIIISDLKEGLEGCPVFSFGLSSPLCVAKSPHIWTEVSSKLSTNICIETILPISNCPFHMYQLWTIISSDLKEGLEGCPVLSFCLFSQPCSQISPHLNWSLQQVLNHHLHQTCKTNIKLSFPYMYPLWTIIISDLKEGLEGCPVLSFCLFSQPCSQISPHLNLSLQQVLNHHLHQTCITNIKLSFLYVPTMNYYHLWPERRVRRVSCPQFWPFFPHYVWPNLPTSKLKSPASCQPTSA